MTVSTNPTDDIIELTEIVEEGIPLDKAFEDFAMDKAVDSKSLDRELDDLLRDAEPRAEAAPQPAEEIDLDILFDEPAPAAPRPEPAPAKTPAAGIDMSDLDDLFDSLGLGEKEDGDTALDIILDGDIPPAETPGAETFAPSDSIDLDLPGLEDQDMPGAALDQTGEPPADIPDATPSRTPEEPVLESAEPAEAEAESPAQSPAQDQAEEGIDILDLTEELADDPESSAQESPVSMPAGEGPEAEPSATRQPEAGLPEPTGTERLEPEPAAADAVEPTATAPLENFDQGHAPASPPVTSGPEQDASARIAPPAGTSAPESAISRDELDVIGARLDALESFFQSAPAVKAEDVLAALPLSPQDLPVAQTLRREILEHVEARLADLASNASVNGLQESVNALQSQVESVPDIRAELAKTPSLSALQKMEAQIEELRAQTRTREELQPEQILALLPQSPQGWPVAQALRQEIMEHVETRVAELAAISSVDGLQESVNALQSQVESMPDVRAELAKTPSLSALQKMEAQIEELRATTRAQEETVSALRQALADKDAALAELSAGEARLREELAALAAQADPAAALEAVRSELREYVRQQAPLAAAKVIREEIQTLLGELGG